MDLLFHNAVGFLHEYTKAHGTNEVTNKLLMRFLFERAELDDGDAIDTLRKLQERHISPLGENWRVVSTVWLPLVGTYINPNDGTPADNQPESPNIPPWPDFSRWVDNKPRRRKGTSSKVVQGALERMAQRGDSCVPRRYLAQIMKLRFGSCSSATVQKAFDNSEMLRDWEAKATIVRQTKKEAVCSDRPMTDIEINEALEKIKACTPAEQWPATEQAIVNCDAKLLADLLPLYLHDDP